MTTPEAHPERDADGAADEAGPSLRQRLHAATGDRDAEAEALRDHAPDEVRGRDAKIAVQRARGERGVGEPETVGEIATPADAEQVRRDLGP